MHSLLRSRAISFIPPTSICKVSPCSRYDDRRTHIIDPAFTFFRQWTSSEREDRVVELEIMREEPEEINQTSRQRGPLLV
jgi:hypothetical protein